MSSIIYKNITLYRMAMQMLYGGRYYRRYDPILNFLKERKPASIFELCFGDTVVAEYCRRHQIAWKGIDMNPKFVARACKLGFDATQKSIVVDEPLTPSEGVIIIGSLYHFKKDSQRLVENVLQHAKWILINEPINSYAQHKRLGKMAARLSDTGKGAETFRFDARSLEQLGKEICKNSLYSYAIVHHDKKEMTLLIEKK